MQSTMRDIMNTITRRHYGYISKKGLMTALSCYIIWGLLPLYWALLNHVSPYNILAQRIIGQAFAGHRRIWPTF